MTDSTTLRLIVVIDEYGKIIAGSVITESSNASSTEPSFSIGTRTGQRPVEVSVTTDLIGEDLVSFVETCLVEFRDGRAVLLRRPDAS